MVFPQCSGHTSPTDYSNMVWNRELAEFLIHYLGTGVTDEMIYEGPGSVTLELLKVVPSKLDWVVILVLIVAVLVAVLLYCALC